MADASSGPPDADTAEDVEVNEGEEQEIEEEEEDEFPESYWGDELLMKSGQWKSVSNKFGVKGSVAVVVRGASNYLLIKDFEVHPKFKEPVSLYVSWEKPKKRVR